MGRPAKRVRISITNLCQIETSFLKSHHKVKNNSSSISKWCMSNGRQRRAIDSIFLCFYINLRQLCLFSEQTGVFLSETDSELFLDLDESVCCSVLQHQLKILVPRKKVSGRSWWNTRRNTWGWIHRDTKNIHQKEIWTQYKLAESNLKHSRYVSTNHQIFGFIET